MTLQQLRYVIQIAASGSITAAASVLYMRQPSLSKAVSELESELGVQLFERSAQGVSLTDEGERFVAYARDVVEQADRLEDRYKDAGGPRGALALSAPHDETVISAIIEVVRASTEERFEFRLREARTEQIIEDVRTQRSELGVALRSARNADAFNAAVRRAGLRFAPFTSVRPSVVVAKGNPLAERGSVSLDDLAPLIQVEYAASESLRSGLDAVLLELPKPARYVHVNDGGTAHRFINELGGYAVTVELLPGSWRHAGLVSLQIEGAPRVDAGIVSAPGVPLTRPAHDFAKLLTSNERLHVRDAKRG